MKQRKPEKRISVELRISADKPLHEILAEIDHWFLTYYGVELRDLFTELQAFLEARNLR